MMDQEKVWVILPALNASRTLPKTICDIQNLPLDVHILVVDDGSTDSTRTCALQCGAEVLSNPKNEGYGASVKKGVLHALARGGTRFVTMGADNQRDVRDILFMLQTLNQGGYEIVLGSKLLSGKEKIPAMRKWGNLFFRWVFNGLYGTKFSDITSGFKVFNSAMAGRLSDLANDYAFDADLCAKITLHRCSYAEVPTHVFYHSESTRMKNEYAVALRILFTILKRRFCRDERSCHHASLRRPSAQ